MRQHKGMANSKTESNNSAVGLRGSGKAEQLRNTVLGKCFLSRRGIDLGFFHTWIAWRCCSETRGRFPSGSFHFGIYANSTIPNYRAKIA